MKKKLIVLSIVFFTLLLMLPFSFCNEVYSQQVSINNIDHTVNLKQFRLIDIYLSLNEMININNTKILQKQATLDYIKVVEITGWDEDIAKYFVSKAELRGVSVFEEVLPLIAVETGNTYRFDLVNYNTNGTTDKGVFQINDLTHKSIIKLLKAEGKEFESWSRLNPEFSIAAGMCWISYLKNNYGLENDALFTSYNKGVGGAKSHVRKYGTYESGYSKKIDLAKENILNYKNKSIDM